MTFDPFGDFEKRGYLRNVARTKNPKIVRQMEHASFTTGLDAAFAKLAAQRRLSYQDVLNTHNILFDAVYPWAGEDRLTNAPGIGVSKGAVLFARPDLIQRTVDYALEKGQDKAFMLARPGEIMGHLAYGHPFLDGNGRTIMVLHSVLAQRAGFGINWAATDKTDYLIALTEEIENPKGGGRSCRTRARRAAGSRMRVCATLPAVIARHRVGATRRPMTGSSGRSSIPETLMMESRGRSVLDTRMRGV